MSPKTEHHELRKPYSRAVVLGCTGALNKTAAECTVKLSLDLIGYLLLGVPSPPQYEYEEERHGHQSHYRPQCSCCDHACIGSWETDHRSGFALTESKKNAASNTLQVLGFFFTVYVQVITSRLMEQLSEPAVLLARQMYFPDMLLVRLLSLRVPCLSSVDQPHGYTHVTIIYSCDPGMWAWYN